MSCLLLNADEKVSTELKKQIVQARTAKKLTQAQLAQVCFLGWAAALYVVQIGSSGSRPQWQGSIAACHCSKHTGVALSGKRAAAPQSGLGLSWCNLAGYCLLIGISGDTGGHCATIPADVDVRYTSSIECHS